MKKSGGAQFSGTYIMYALVAIALLLLVIFIVRGSLVEHYTGATSSQWKRTRSAEDTTNSNYVTRSLTYSNAPGTSDDVIYTKYKVKEGASNYSIKDFLNMMQSILDTRSNSNEYKCYTLGIKLQKASSVIGLIKTEIQKFSGKGIKNKKDKDLYTARSKHFNKHVIDKFNDILDKSKRIPCSNIKISSISPISS